MDHFWMPVHFDDWHNATREMSPAEFLAFFHVCVRAWRSSDRQWPPGCVPDDDEKLARIIGGPRPKQSIAAVREIFRPSTDYPGFLAWPHLSETLHKAIAKGTKTKERAKGAARARWGGVDAPSNATSNAPSIEQAPSEDAVSMHSYSQSQNQSESNKENESTVAAAAATAADHSDLQKLLTAVNAGVLAGYGIQKRGITEDTSGSRPFLSFLRQAGIDVEFAAGAIEAHAASHPGETAPGSLTYFKDAVKEKWGVECAIRAKRAPAPVVDHEAIQRERAITLAQGGSSAWQRKCDDEGVEWRETAMARHAEKKRVFRIEQ